MKPKMLERQKSGALPARQISTIYRVLVMAFFVLLAVVFVPRFASPGNLLNLVRNISLLCLMGCGMALSMLIGGLDLSIGSVAALSTVLGATIISGGNIFLGVAATLLMGGAMGLLNGFMIARFKLPDFIMTFSMMYIARGLALTYTQGQAIYNLPDAFTWIGKGSLGPVPMPIVFAFLALLVLLFVLRRTTFGRGIYAVGSSHKAAQYTGISVANKQMIVYLVSGILAALVGLVYIARLNSANADLGQSWPLDAIAVCVIGGMSFAGGEGNILGLLIGGTVMGIIGNCINLLGVPSRFQDFCVGFVIIVAVAADHYGKKRQ